MPKFHQCHRQPRAPRKRSVPSVNDHPAIVDIFRKFSENGSCIQTIFFRVTMAKLNMWKHFQLHEQSKTIFSSRNKCVREKYWHQQNTQPKKPFFAMYLKPTKANEILRIVVKLHVNTISFSKVMTFFIWRGMFVPPGPDRLNILW